MSKLKLLFITHEMSPFLELTKIAEITRQLPQAMQEKGFEIRILMPRFGNINERRNRLHEVIRLSGMNIVINDNDNPLIIKVASVPAARMQVYFMDNEEYFHRKYVFRDKENKFYGDNDERMIFFCKGALETVKKLGWAPDVVHCHGWMTSLIPLYLKTIYKGDPTFKNSRVVYSLYENGFAEKLDASFRSKILSGKMNETHTQVFGEGTSADLDLGAIHYADALVVGSENISEAVLNNVKTSTKPTLELDQSQDFENYSNFYDEITSEELVNVA